MYRTEPPTDKTIREWFMKFQQSGCLCAAKRRGRPGPDESFLYRESNQNFSMVQRAACLLFHDDMAAPTSS